MTLAIVHRVSIPAPHTHIATVRVAGPQQGSLLRAVTDALPNVTGIRVEDVLAAVAALLDQVAAALAATGSLTLIAGALVLVGAVAATQRRRTREAVILKVLGESTARTDLVTKNQEYAAIGSVRRYIVLAQDEMAGTMFERIGDDWVGHLLNAASILRMPEIGIEVALDELYQGVAFPEPERQQS